MDDDMNMMQDDTNIADTEESEELEDEGLADLDMEALDGEFEE